MFLRCQLVLLVVLIVKHQNQNWSQQIAYFTKYTRYQTDHIDYYLFDNIINGHTTIRATSHNYKSINLNFDWPASQRSRPHAPQTSLLNHHTHALNFNEPPFKAQNHR